MNNIRYYIFSLIFLIINLFSSCGSDIASVILDEEEPIIYRYGYDESKHIFEEKKVGRNDTFGDILEGQGIDYPEIYKVLEKTKNDVDFRILQRGKPYTLIFSNDSIPSLKAFVYHPTIEGLSLIHI